MLASWVSELSNPPGLAVRAGQGSDWGPIEPVREWLAGPFSGDVCAPTGVSHFAGNGPQPTCPCNMILYVAGSEGSWGESEEIGTGHFPAEMEWPQEVSLHVRNQDGTPFVVWRHESYEMLMPVDERLILGRREGGTWSFDGDLAIGRNARQPDVSTSASGHVWVVWSDDSDGSFDLYLATTESLAGLPELTARVGGELRVYPNPTKHLALVEWKGMGLTNPRLCLRDALGRSIGEFGLPAGLGSTDESGVSLGRADWEFVDRDGRMLPAGVYFLELRDGERLEGSSRVVLAR